MKNIGSGGRGDLITMMSHNSCFASEEEEKIKSLKCDFVTAA